MKNERWKWVKGFEGRYEISDHGRLRTWVFKNKGSFKKLDTPKLLNGGNDRGYVRYSLAGVAWSAHALVLETFVGPRPKGLFGCHLDGVRNNNHYKNLVWATPKENTHHMFGHGTAPCGDNNVTSKIKVKDVAKIKKRLANGVSCQTIADEYGVTNATISNIKRGKYYAFALKEYEKGVGET